MTCPECERLQKFVGELSERLAAASYVLSRAAERNGLVNEVLRLRGMTHTQTTWTDCYDAGWRGLIVDEAFAHPAKFARTLIGRIYRHMLERGWLRAGDVVVDPFGGVALGGLDAMANGLHWIGCELEPKFVDLGNRNIAEWVRRWGHSQGWGTARLVQGDSRRLVEVVAEAGCVVSSPPFVESLGDKPSAGLLAGSGGRMGASQKNDDGYGHTPGQLGSMPPGSVDAVLSSPPYADHLGDGSNGIDTTKMQRASAGQKRGPGTKHEETFQSQSGGYSRAPGNLGNSTGETFWAAAKQIVQQCHAILKPGGYAAWVCKDFVRNKQRVPFSADWVKLCEACGFRLVEWVKASLVKDLGQHADLYGETHHRKVERKSFFRRLAEKKGSPRIDHEDVVFLVRL